MRGRWRYWIVVGVALAGLIPGWSSAAVAGSGPESTVSSPTTTTTMPRPDGGVPGNIIPRPNSGTAPEDPGDRGGWEQWALLVAIVAALAAIVALVVGESRRKRARG